MTTTDQPTWADIVDEYTNAYGGAPGLSADVELAELYARHPTITRHRLREARDAHDAGRIHSPWGFVLTSMREHDRARAAKPQDVDREREREIHLAESHIRNAGIYLPSEAELLDDVFGDHGRLKPWSHDLTLRDRMLTLYRQERPRGVQSEADYRERAEKFKTARSKPATDDIPL